MAKVLMRCMDHLDHRGRCALEPCEKCLWLSSELRAYAPLAPQLQQMGWLAGLASETSALCERELLKPLAEEWKYLRQRVMSALKGDPP